MTETKRAVAYPAAEQYEVWENRADEMGYRSTSQFVQDMVEAGSKKFTVQVEPDETNQELRQHRNELRDELDKARDRIQDLEEQLYDDERAEIVDFVEENPGCDIHEIIQHVLDTVPMRVNRHLDDLEGKKIHSTDDRYYPSTGVES